MFDDGDYEANCTNCLHKDSCGYFDDPRGSILNEIELFEEHCVGCCCGDGSICNRDKNSKYSGCSNWEHESTPLDKCLG